MLEYNQALRWLPHSCGLRGPCGGSPFCMNYLDLTANTVGNRHALRITVKDVGFFYRFDLDGKSKPISESKKMAILQNLVQFGVTKK